MHQGDSEDRFLMAIPRKEQLQKVLRYLLDEGEFLSPYGIRSLSKASKIKYVDSVEIMIICHVRDLWKLVVL